MTERNRPRIFIITDIIEIFEKADSELKSIKENIIKTSIQESWIEKSTYTYIYSIFETTLYQTFHRILIAFPDYIKKQEIKNIGDLMFSSSLMTPLVEIVATTFARDFAYGKIEEILKQYNDIVKIGLNIKDCVFISELKQYKEERNLLVHTGITPTGLNKKEILDKTEFIKSIIDFIKVKFESKYSQFTKEYLIKESWSYIFNDVLPFERCFYLSCDKNTYIVNKKYIDERATSLSSSEKMLFTLFLSNYSSMVLKDAIKIQDLCMFANLTQYTKNKIGYILELFQKYPLLLQ